MNQYSYDTISSGVQFIGLDGGDALAMTTGSLTLDSDGDLNGDGFNEQEGAYIIQASNNTVHFKLPAEGDTCRYYPAFRITNYLAANKPQYVFAYRGLAAGDTMALVEGYQYNCHLNQTDHELVMQIDSIFCDSVALFISSDQTLAVQMSLFATCSTNPYWAPLS